MIFKAENVTPSKGSLETWPLNSQDRPGIVGTQASCRVTSSRGSYPTPCSGSRRLLNCKEKASHIKANETRGPPVAPGWCLDMLCVERGSAGPLSKGSSITFLEARETQNCRFSFHLHDCFEFYFILL